MGVSPQKKDEKTALPALDIDPEVLLSASTDPLLVVDASGAILFANPMTDQLVGNPGPQFMGEKGRSETPSCCSGRF